MSYDLIDSLSLDQQPNFPDRKLPMGFMLRLAKALHTYGMTAYEMERTMQKVGSRLGFGVQCLSQPTNIIMSFSHPEEPEPKTYVFRVEPGEVDLDKQIQIDSIVNKVISESYSIAEGAIALKETCQSPVRYGKLPILSGFALVSGAIATVLGGTLLEVIVALIAGLCSGLIATFLIQNETSKYLFPTLASVLSAFLASSLAGFGILPSPYIATVSGVIVLVPGLHLTTAIAELAHQNMVSGTARLFSAATIFMQIGFGVVIGDALGRLLSPDLPVFWQYILPAWSMWVAIGLAGVGLFFLFVSRPEDFLWIILASYIAFAFTVIGNQWLGPIMGPFLGAFATGISANIFERLRGITRSVILMPGIILLVPGSIGYHALSLMVQKNIIEGIESAFNVGFVAIALVTGLLLSSLIVPPQGD